MSESSGDGSGPSGDAEGLDSSNSSGADGPGSDSSSSSPDTSDGSSYSSDTSSPDTSSSQSDTTSTFQSKASKPPPAMRSDFRSARGPSASFDHVKVSDQTGHEESDPNQPAAALTLDGSTDTPAKAETSTAEPNIDPNKLPNTTPPQGPSEANFNFQSGSSRQKDIQPQAEPSEENQAIDDYVAGKKAERDAEARDPDGHSH